MKPSGTKTMWQPTIPVNQSIYESLGEQQAPLGTRLEVGDRCFFYAYVAESVSAGYIVTAPVVVGSHAGAIVTAASNGKLSKVITCTLGTLVTKNQYAEGYVIISTGGTSEGYAYRIKSHPAAATAATDLEITIYDELEDDIAATSELSFVPNMYDSVIVGSEVLGHPVGVVPCDVTTGYAWLQTFGPAAVKQVAATPAANVIRLGTTGGAIAIFDVTTNTGTALTGLPIGKNMNLAATAAEFNPTFLTIRQ